MRYLGGKKRIGREIAEILKIYAPPDCVDGYLEPFCGSLGVTIHMVDDYECYISDINKDLILLWKDIKANRFCYPTSVSKETWLKYKHSKIPSSKRAFIGFGCSFSGLWFKAYADDYKSNHSSSCKETVLSLKKIEHAVQKLKKIENKSYEKHNPKNMLIYCDPPYVNTSKYRSTPDFDTIRFWNIMRLWSKNNIVIISELSAPKDFKCIWRKKRYSKLGGTETYITEKLFIHNSKLTT